MKDLVKQVMRFVINSFASPFAPVVGPIINGIIDQIPGLSNEQAPEVVGIISEHLKVFTTTYSAADSEQMKRAARATFEIGLTRALRDRGFLDAMDTPVYPIGDLGFEEEGDFREEH